MRAPVMAFIVLTSCLALGGAQYPVPTTSPNPAPRGREVQHGLPDEQSVQAEPQPKNAPVNAAQFRRDAEELAKLAQSVSSQADMVAGGLFPKDLNEKLKRIEKLSKHLRRELSQ